jgi:hypothetical protein
MTPIDLITISMEMCQASGQMLVIIKYNRVALPLTARLEI